MATLSGMQHRVGAVQSRPMSFPVPSTTRWNEELFSSGTARSDVVRSQDLVVDICVPELLAAMPANVVGRALSDPALFLQRTWALARHGTTELVLLEDADELLQPAIDTHGNSGKPRGSEWSRGSKGVTRAWSEPLSSMSAAQIIERRSQRIPSFARRGDGKSMYSALAMIMDRAWGLSCQARSQNRKPARGGV